MDKILNKDATKVLKYLLSFYKENTKKLTNYSEEELFKNCDEKLNSNQFHNSLVLLKELGYIGLLIRDNKIMNVTIMPKGDIYFSSLCHDYKKMILGGIIFPIIVAFITALITTLILK